MERMMNDLELCERLASAIHTATLDPDGPVTLSRRESRMLAVTTLAVLGLDDLDAAVERTAARLGRFGDCYRNPEIGPYPGSEDDYLRDCARAALEAALTATEGGDSAAG